MPQVSLTALVTHAKAGDRVISFPTDTVPALAVRPDCADLIFTAKQRSQEKPLILMAATPNDLWPFVQGEAEAQQIWQEVATRYWPGALTLVLPASDRVPTAIHPQDLMSIGLRVPNHPVAQAILAQTGPLATTSANLSGQPPLETMTAIAAQFPEVLLLSPEELAYLIPAGQAAANHWSESASGVPSTVIKWSDSTWQVLRSGAVKLEL
ncbi:L-threonylcarbamoyladenylate synthase [Trichocoleus sp. FACHB-262]|uniref:L-threonylcarbamoyladenylate synthase n=1 Tax=Trichocoleus sp. FACHB-262 TaxID=2692869 RepID=UPI0016851B4D|nr:L-threonylcarbamoyladenylate synthase [Trichocoleus sp. FACHB-262]MBD2123690.1 L-threonylcarbamoyladenylate synthase [Trichocoleus sp. FACHB-262]